MRLRTAQRASRKAILPQVRNPSRHENARRAHWPGDWTERQVKENSTVDAVIAIGGNMIQRKTLFSDDRKFRYTLWREFYPIFATDGAAGKVPIEGNKSHHFVMFIGLNPSTATETEDDPTNRRCIRFAKEWGFGAYCMTNLFAFCTAYPKVLTEAGHPIGEPGNYITVGNAGFDNRNDYWLYLTGREAGLIVAAWGSFPQAVERAKTIRKMFAGKLYCLGQTANGSPKHPLYLQADTKPILYDEPK